MRSLFIALSTGILLLSACSESKTKILSEKKMTQLMTEVHLLDGYLATLPIDSSRKIIDTLYVQLFAKYGLDSASFSENLTRYYSDPEKTEKIYDKIHEDLTGREREIMRLDSIRSAVQRDSTARVNRYNTLLSMQHNLRYVYQQTDAPLEISEYNAGLHKASGLNNFWQSGSQRIPSRASTARPPDPHAHIPTSVRVYEDELQDSLLSAFEVYKKSLYQSIGLPRLWTDRSSLKDLSEHTVRDSVPEIGEGREEIQEEPIPEENEQAP